MKYFEIIGTISLIFVSFIFLMIAFDFFLIKDNEFGIFFIFPSSFCIFYVFKRNNDNQNKKIKEKLDSEAMQELEYQYETQKFLRKIKEGRFKNGN